MVADFQNIELIAEENSIKDTARGGEDAPAMELTQLVHGHIRGIVVRDTGEGLWWCVPQRPQKVGDTLEVLGDSNNRN